ncbi:MAG: Na+/H+ antiporter subunit E [Campylobacterales bacterium]
MEVARKLRGFHLFATIKLLLFFLYNSTKGGVQVALFAMQPRLCLSPFIYEHKLKTKSNFATSMLVNIYSLMPGTLSMGVENGVLYLHILDKKLFCDEFINRVEEYVIEVFDRRLS